MSEKPSLSPWEAPVESGWNRLVTKLLESSRTTQVDGLVHFETRTGTVGTVRILEGSPRQFSWLERTDSAGSVRTTVFLNSSGEADSITRTEHSLRDFNNRIHHGKNRWSLTSELVFRQTFDSSGMPEILLEYAPNAIAELHIHTRTFLAGNSHETANSFLWYGLGDAGVCQSSDRKTDLTPHFPIPGRISIIERRNPSENADSIWMEELITDRKVPYEVGMSESGISVSMGGKTIGNFSVFNRFGLPEILSALYGKRSEEISDRTLRSLSGVLEPLSP